MSNIPNEQVTCRSCGYVGEIGSYAPCFSIYNDIRCPKCGSTSNQHNSDYQDRLSEAMREHKRAG